MCECMIENSVQINFACLGNKEIYSIFIFQIIAIYFIMLSFLVEIMFTFFINDVLKFKHQPSHFKVNLMCLT